MKSQISTHLFLAGVFVLLLALLGSKCLDFQGHEGRREAVTMMRRTSQDRRELEGGRAAENKGMETNTRNKKRFRKGVDDDEIIRDTEDKERNVEDKKFDNAYKKKVKKNKLLHGTHKKIDKGGYKNNRKGKKFVKVKKIKKLKKDSTKPKKKKIAKKKVMIPVNNKKLKFRRKHRKVDEKIGKSRPGKVKEEDQKVNNSKPGKLKEEDKKINNSKLGKLKEEDKKVNNNNKPGKIKEEGNANKGINKKKPNNETEDEDKIIKSITTSKENPVFSFKKYLLAECGETYMLTLGISFLFTTDGGQHARNCRTTFRSPLGTTIKFFCPVFSLRLKKCKKERLFLIENKRVNWPFCKTDVVDIETIGTHLLVHHKRGRLMRRQCPGAFLCEASLGHIHGPATPAPLPPRPPVRPPITYAPVVGPPITYAPVVRPPVIQPAVRPPATYAPVRPPAPLPGNKRPFCPHCSPKDITITRIVGGVPAAEGELPHQAYLHIEKRTICSGTLITSTVVVTAAHCYTIGWRQTEVTLGEYDINENEYYSQSRTVKNVVTHPDFTKATMDNDIALLELDRAVEITPHVAPACVVTATDVFKSDVVVVAGWGHTTYSGYTSDIIMKVGVHVITNQECQKMYQSRGYVITDNMMCTYTQEKDACQGDSGGPLMRKEADGTWVLVGITSFGYRCAYNSSPGVFTNVLKYNDWIRNNAGVLLC